MAWGNDEEVGEETVQQEVEVKLRNSEGRVVEEGGGGDEEGSGNDESEAIAEVLLLQ